MWWLEPRACRWPCVCACVHGTCICPQVRSSGALSARVGSYQHSNGCGGAGGGFVRGGVLGGLGDVWVGGYPRVLSETEIGMASFACFLLSPLFVLLSALSSLPPLPNPLPLFPPPSHPCLLRSVPSVRYHEKDAVLVCLAEHTPPPILCFSSRCREKHLVWVPVHHRGAHPYDFPVLSPGPLPFPLTTPPLFSPTHPHPPSCLRPLLPFASKLPLFCAAKESRA